MVTRIDFLRHGEPENGARYRGHAIDDQLTEKGWRQMKQGVGDFADWDVIVSSPLRRCAEFAQWLGQQRSIPVVIQNDLREIGFGQWEGKTKAELRETRATEFKRFYEDPVRNTPEDAEPVMDFCQRISAVLEQCLNAYDGQSILLVGHAGMIRAGLVFVLQAPIDQMYRFEINNGRISRCRLDDEKRVVEGINIIL